MQGPLQGAALLGQVAAPVGGDAAGQGAVGLGEALLGDHRDQFGAAPGPHEGDRADALPGQVGQQVRGLGGGRAAHRRAALPVQLGQRRLPQGEDQFAARGGVVGDLGDRQTGEAAGGPGGVGGGGGGEEEDRLGAVPGADPAQAPQHLGDVGAEDAPVGVALVDHDVAQGAQEGGPPGVGGEHAPVQHVGVGQDEVRVLADPLAFLDRRVAVVEGGADPVAQRGGQLPDGAPLVGGEGLGGGEVEGGGPAPVGGLGTVQEGGEDRGEVGEGLARGGAGGDHHGLAVEGVLGGLRLVGPRMLDPGLLDGRDHLRADAVRPDRMTTRPGGHVLRMSDARGPALARGEPVQDHAGRGAAAPVPGGTTGAVILGHRHRVCHRHDGQCFQGVVHGCG